MEELMLRAKGQIIDSMGKSRALIFQEGKNNIALIHDPIAPLQLPIFGSAPREIDVEKALMFIKDAGMQIKSLVIPSKKITGVIAILRDREYYVPVKDSLFKKEFDYEIINYEIDPLFRSGENSLKILEVSRKAATIIKAYVLWTYSRDPAGWQDQDSFVVVDKKESEWVSEILSLNSRLYEKGNAIIFSNGKIKVPTEELVRKLLNWLEVQKIRDPVKVKKFSLNTIVPGVFETITDFNTRPRQIVFVNKNGLLKWLDNRDKLQSLTIASIEIKETTEPYFVSTEPPVLVQCVKNGDLKRAFRVIFEWEENKINYGYYSLPIENKKFEILKEVDFRERTEIQKSLVVEYIRDSKKYYAAILVL
jgi:hypothetical protein